MQAIEYILPDSNKTLEDISLLSSIDKEVLYGSLGDLKIPVSSDAETPFTLATQAVLKLLKSNCIDTKKLDYIIYASSGVNDYQIWSPAAKIQKIINADNAFCFEISNGCNAFMAALHLVNGILNIENPGSALLIMSDTLSKFIDYSETENLHLLSFSDGADAVYIDNYSNKNLLISSALVTDGAYSDVVKLSYGGVFEYNAEKKSNSKYMSVNLPDESRESFYKTLINNYIHVIEKCIVEAKLKTENIKYFLLGRNSQKVLDAVFKYFLVSPDKILTTQLLGHVGSIDVAITLKICLKKSLVHSGDYVLIASTGSGYQRN
ncbi:MAG: hypothetical protein A3F13_09700 [Gammaproteobacteria bacterium RIFCSPHIGHO2_12_FULL_40_19]|nr:MAG: hypothetical protein A3F13_09700 [Gammaproteobacteria bacterium RIFCSPHIGHO2_12_FULL_40_19]